VHEGVRFFLSRGRTARATDARKDRIAATLSASCDRARRTASALEAELTSAERATEYERSGNLLMAHAGAIPRGTTTVDLEDERGKIRITLEPQRSAMENARRYFDRSKSARRARREAEQRLVVVRTKLERAAALLEELQPITRPEDVETFLRTHEDALPAFGVSASGEPARPALFRTFLVDGGFEVLAGKNSTNNDLLTLKHARPEDLWFHARGGSGSHVVLRVGSARGEPGKAAREQAAAIAAYFSSMKTSRMAPVAMTRRKYVRKPKGAPPGTVVIEREEVLFVTPALPAGASS
jgi:predicted ribosome quality control (RQC) complex YloA/Tae2 family protein